MEVQYTPSHFRAGESYCNLADYMVLGDGPLGPTYICGHMAHGVGRLGMALAYGDGLLTSIQNLTWERRDDMPLVDKTITW